MSRRPVPSDWPARLVALIVALASAGVIIYLNRNLLWPSADTATQALNPAFLACRERRVGEVGRMRDGGVIDDKQYVRFRERAIAMCAGRYPPGATPP